MTLRVTCATAVFFLGRNSAREAGAAAELASPRKAAKYRNLTAQYDVLPVRCRNTLCNEAVQYVVARSPRTIVHGLW